MLGKTLTEIAAKDDKIVAVTAAMTGSLGLNPFFEKYPERAVDVGICEEHATILCASMAAEGYKPYYAVYSTFLQRSFDEIIIDICSQNLPVTLCIDRAGISGADGETHQGVFDLSFLVPVPGLTIAVPKDKDEFAAMLEFSAGYGKPLAIRYPRACTHSFGPVKKVEAGTWELLKKGDGRVAVLACGERAIARAFAAAEKAERKGVSASVINARFVKPMDEKMLASLKENVVLTVEDNMAAGGFGSLVAEYYSASAKRVKIFGYSDTFIEQGGVDELMDDYGLSVDAISDYIIKSV